MSLIKNLFIFLFHKHKSMYSITNPVFRNFLFYSVGSITKMMIMSLLTGRQRFAKLVNIDQRKKTDTRFVFLFKAFANPEDIIIGDRKTIKPTLLDPDVERVRRNHLNDIENILPFVLIGFGYVACNPSVDIALWHFRLFFFSRILHTLAYQVTRFALEMIDESFFCRFLCHNQHDFWLFLWDISRHSQWPFKFFERFFN